MALCCCTLSRQQLRHLHINTPLWRFIIAVRSITALVACMTIAAYAVCISVPLSVAENLNSSGGGGGGGSSSTAWQWGDVWIESLAFVPPAVSLLQSAVTITYLLSTTNLTHSAIELIIELVIVLVMAFPIVFCAAVSGPLQRWQSSDHSSHLTNNDELAGLSELIGFIGLCILEILHFGLFVSSCHRMHVRRRNKIAMARAAAMKLEAGWGMYGEEGTALRSPARVPEARLEEPLPPSPRPQIRRQVDDIMAPPTAEELRRRAREENAQTERQADGARRPSSVSALSSRWGARRSSSWGRRPSSLDGYMPQGRRRTEASQIGLAIGKLHEIWVPVTELRSESPLMPYRVVNDHEVVIVGDGEVKVVSTPREEVFMGWSTPEPVTPRIGGERDNIREEANAEAEEKLAERSPDPDVPAPLKVRKSVKSFKLGNSWEMYKELEEAPPIVDQGW